MMGMGSRGVAALVLVLVAVAGVLGGIALDRVVLLPQAAAARHMAGPMLHRRPVPQREDAFRARLARDLDLTGDQRRVIDSLMDIQLRELRALRDESQPRVESVIGRTRRAIDSVLTPEQRARVEELGEHRRRRRGGTRRSD